MALVDNFPGNHQHGSSRLMMIQARFQQRQQEEKEHKLFAMLEEQHDAAAGDGGGGGGLGLIPATRTHSNGSSNSQHNSASSTASLSSSLGSSLASSLGSTGSGMAVVPGGGKVRQMFEDRRNQINGRPPVYSKNAENRKNIPVTTRGWDRSHPLDPLPSSNSHDRNLKVPTGSHSQQQRSRARGVSLERGAHAFGDGPSDSIRRSKSQYQVDDVPGGMIRSPNKRPTPSDGHQQLLNVSATLKPKSMTSLLDDNQNNVNNHSTIGNKTIPRFGYNQSPVRNPSQRYQPNYREDVVDGGNSGRTVGQQYRGRISQTNDEYHTADRTEESSRQAASLAAAAVAAAAETTRRLEREKAQIQAEAKRREEELMNTIRQQQQQLQRLQQAAMLAEQKAKAAAAATATKSRPTRTSYRPPDESDDSKSSVSDDAVISPPSSRGWNPTSTAKKPMVNRNHEMSPPPSAPKPKLAPKPVLESPTPAKSTTTTMPRKSIFATGPTAGGKDGLVSCSLCGRNFASDRIEKHEGICAKTKAKKRKVFDITKMRVKGTEAESFVLVPPGRNNQQNSTANNKKPISVGQHILQQQQQATKSAIAPSAKALEDGKKADWRKKHESFIEAIRAAKAMQKHLKAGGKVSDLPPPPPSDTSDYITCPYCQRRFAPGAADRHIPKCSSILSNKKTVRK